MKKRIIEGIYYFDNKPISIEVSDDRILKIIRNDSVQIPESFKTTIIPGFIDNQINGGLGIDFSSEHLTINDVQKVTHRLWQAGVTTYLPTLITNSKKTLLISFRVLAEALENIPKLNNSIPGFHLEGPYISSVVGYRGMHDASHIHPPDWDEFMELNDAAGGRILQVTIAPEMEGAMEFIHKCRENNIIVGLGHHNASTEIVSRAVEAGARISTHLGNGCADQIHRHRNPFWSQLADDKLAISIICDGFHLLKEEIQTFYKIKGVDKILLTSDAGIFAGMPPGEYKHNDREFIITTDGMIKYPSQDVLAGSASFIDRGVNNIMQYTGCSLTDAVQMATLNQTELYGLSDRGVIKEGNRADIIQVKFSQDKFEIQKTYLAGTLVYDSNLDI